MWHRLQGTPLAPGGSLNPASKQENAVSRAAAVSRTARITPRTRAAQVRRRTVTAPTPAPRPQAIGEVRVSTEEQAREGVSLDAQEAKIRAYCTAKDFELTAVVRDEGLSAKTLERPGLQQVIAACQEHTVGAV